MDKRASFRRWRKPSQHHADRPPRLRHFLLTYNAAATRQASSTSVGSEPIKNTIKSAPTSTRRFTFETNADAALDHADPNG